MCSAKVVILLDQSTKDVKRRLCFLVRYCFCLRSLKLRVVRKHPVRTGFTFIGDYKKENVGAHICLFLFAVFHNRCNKQTEKHPRGSILYTVKCAGEETRSSQHTTESICYTPWQLPLHCFGLHSICGSFEQPKTKRDNAFQYVVLRLAIGSSRRVALSGQMRLQSYIKKTKSNSVEDFLIKF